MQEVVHDAERLKELQALPLERKIQISQARIIEWYQHWKGQVCVSFSGGKDSTVLLHLVHQIYPDVKAVFVNTGLEYPEIQKFARQKGADIVTPPLRFNEVITTYGYPLIGKEVAEAIYYARRIRSQDVHVERERERTAERKQRELQGRRKQNEGSSHPDEFCKESENDTSRKMEQWYGYEEGERTRWKIQGFGRRTGVEIPQQTIKSQFNKEKWLPLAQELNANISHYCCFTMKKSPIKKYQRANKVKPYLGTLATESRVRKQAWIRNGCNAFDSKNPSSQPLSFWTEQDILAYIVRYGLEIASVYGEIVNIGDDGYNYAPVDLFGEIGSNLHCTGCERTGCMFCGFGLHLEKGETRFQRLARTHPRQYEYCIGGGKWSDNPNYDPTAPEYDGEWKNWNPKKIWTPSEKGLGMGKLFDMVNDIYGKDFYRY